MLKSGAVFHKGWPRLENREKAFAESIQPIKASGTVLNCIACFIRFEQGKWMWCFMRCIISRLLLSTVPALCAYRSLNLQYGTPLHDFTAYDLHPTFLRSMFDHGNLSAYRLFGHAFQINSIRRQRR